MLAAGLILQQVLRERVGGALATLGALAFLSHDGVLRAAFSSRPYALGLLGIAASVWSLQHLLRSPSSLKPCALHALLTALIAYAQYLFLPVLAMHWLLLLVENHKVWRRLLLSHIPGLWVAAAMPAAFPVTAGALERLEFCQAARNI